MRAPLLLRIPCAVTYAPGLYRPIGWDLAAGKVTIGGEGKSPISFTARVDIARFVAHVLTALPAERLANSSFRIEGERAVSVSPDLPMHGAPTHEPASLSFQSFSDIVDGYQAKSGRTLDVTHRSHSEIEASLKANPADFLSYLQLLWERGQGVVGKFEGPDNGLFPEWRPKKILDVLS